MMAPIGGATAYNHSACSWPETSAGPSDRAVFIEICTQIATLNVRGEPDEVLGEPLCQRSPQQRRPGERGGEDERVDRRRE